MTGVSGSANIMGRYELGHGARIGVLRLRGACRKRMSYADMMLLSLIKCYNVQYGIQCLGDGRTGLQKHARRKIFRSGPRVSEYQRTPLLIVRTERHRRRDVYGSVGDKIGLQAQLLRGAATSRTVVVAMHPIGSPG